jgi:CelD/BcsL family acetyltransferase involved in cellulose biosynthesis
VSRFGGNLDAVTRGTAQGFSASPRISALRTVAFDALDGEELDAWHRLRAANPKLDSPYFHPGFASAVHASGRQVDVVVGRDGKGEVCAVLPVHREGTLLRPVGWPGADFQGPVLAPGTAFPPLKLITGGVRGFAFDHLVESGADFAPWVESSRPSPFVDTSGGLDGYLGRASRSGKDNMGQARRRTAKLEQQSGRVRFDAAVVDEAALARVVQLKRAQYANTGVRDYFAEPDRRALLTRLLHTRDSSFGGLLSTLHAGDHLVAAHFGIRSDNVLHWWFPVYDPAFAAFSPGWILLRELVSACPSLGITRLDLGRGDDEYKRRAKTGETYVSQGVVTRSSARLMLRRARHSLIAAADSTAVGPQLRRAVRKLRSRARLARGGS